MDWFDTRALVQSATIAGTVDSIRTDGYSALGDFGGAVYKRVASEPAHPGKVQSADGAWWEQVFDDDVNVHQFGAVGDGTTDDTQAILDADAFVRTGKGTLNFYPRTYLVDSLTLGGGAPWGEKNCTWRGVGYDGRGTGTLTATLRLKDSASQGYLVGVQPGSGHYIFERITFNGNKANQPSYSGCVHVLDLDPLPAGTYAYSVHMRFCHMYEGRDFGFYLGRNRGWTTLVDCDVQINGIDAGGHGIILDSFDFYLDRVNTGNNAGFGIKFGHVSQGMLKDTASFKNTAGGVQITADCTDFAWSGGSVDRNLANGVEASKSVGTSRGSRTFMGVRFLGNGAATDNTYSDVKCTDAEDSLAFIGCDFMGYDNSAKRVKYFYEFANPAARVRAIGCRYNYAAPPATGFMNAECLLSEQFGQTEVGTFWNGALNITTARNDANGVSITGTKARGSLAAPTATQAWDSLLYLGARGFGSTAYSSSARAAINMKSMENWTDSAQGACITMELTPAGGTSRQEVWLFKDDGLYYKGSKVLP